MENMALEMIEKDEDMIKTDEYDPDYLDYMRNGDQKEEIKGENESREETTVIVNLKGCINPADIGRQISRAMGLKKRTKVAFVGKGLYSWFKGFFLMRTAALKEVRWFDSQLEAENWAITSFKAKK